MASSAFAIEEYKIVCRSNIVEITFHYVNSAKSIALKITERQDQPQKPNYNLQLIHVVSAPRLLHIMNMSLSGYRLDPHHLTPIPSDNENENEGSSSRAVSKVDSSGKGKGLTKELPAKDDDSDDLLKYIPYLDKLEKTEKIAAEVLEKERHDGTYLIKLLDTGDFDEGLVKEFKTMINMTKHMNSMLFKGDKDSKFKVRPRTLKQVEEIAVQVIHYFDKLSDQFDVGIDKIVEIKKYLPSLGTQVSLHHIRTALRTWNAKIMGYVHFPISSFNCF